VCSRQSGSHPSPEPLHHRRTSRKRVFGNFIVRLAHYLLLIFCLYGTGGMRRRNPRDQGAGQSNYLAEGDLPCASFRGRRQSYRRVCEAVKSPSSSMSSPTSAFSQDRRQALFTVSYVKGPGFGLGGLDQNLLASQDGQVWHFRRVGCVGIID